MISRRTSPDSARAIETICCAAGRSAPTFARGGIDSWPRRLSSAAESRYILSRSSSRPRAARLVREEDALRDAQVLDEVELLVDRRDAALQRSGGVARRAAARPRTGSRRWSARPTPDTHLMSVDLPAPLGPSRQWTSASRTSRSTPCSALTPGYSLTRSRTSRTFCGVGVRSLDHQAAQVVVRDLQPGLDRARACRPRPGPRARRTARRRSRPRRACRRSGGSRPGRGPGSGSATSPCPTGRSRAWTMRPKNP